MTKATVASHLVRHILGNRRRRHALPKPILMTRRCGTFSRFRSLILLWLLAILLSVALVGCAAGAGMAEVHMVPTNLLPSEMQSAPTRVRAAYQFAAANPQVSMNVPCYCGCDSLGHTSNFQCYVSRVEPGGVLIYDHHAIGCATCVNITQDSMRLLKEGKDVATIRAYVIATYSKYEPAYMP